MKKILTVCLMLSFVFVFSCASGGGGAAQVTGELFPGTWEWEVENDANDGGTSTIEMIDNGDGSRTFKGTVTNKYQYGMGSVTLKPDAATLEKLKVAKAIKFKMQSVEGKAYIAEACLSSVTDWGFHQRILRTNPGEAMDFHLQFKSFIQPPWGTQKRFNTELLTHIRILTKNAAEGGLGDYEFKVWDFALEL
ncbi:MAG: CIA30 family protein [Treponema sp.]|jgi:hypothetical protein|nr:CIA30 family protein [Treponema sp.]